MLPGNEYVEVRKGGYYVAGTRIGLDIVVYDFRRGRSAKRSSRHTRPFDRSRRFTAPSPAMRSKLEPFKKFARMLRSHLDGILAWTRSRVSNAAVEGMNNKIQSISHRSFGFRSAAHFIAAIYHCCARLPLPAKR